MSAEGYAVVIGRNEGARLVTCLAALAREDLKTIYVDSGSTDNSVTEARAIGAEVVELDTTLPFTAARARNAGLAKIPAQDDGLWVQFIDGDCELQPGWIAAGTQFLAQSPEVAVVCGRVRERHADATLYNRLADAEWETPIGESRACGGIAMMRVGPLRDVGGFREDLIAGEEGELCIRLRQAGWKIWRLDTEMVLHDIAMTRFSQWWRRVRRGGHAAAEGMSLHGQAPEYHKVSAVRRAMLWGVALPVVTILGVLIVGPLALVLLLVWPLQVVRLQRRGLGWDQAAFMTLAKLPEAQGMLGYWLQRMRGARRALIEYK